VFSPSRVGPDWRPYSDGRWIYTDDGWMWDSEEPWGWASYHYGRWFYQPSHGWCWLPGTEWAPSWVVFRSGEGWFGWAPMPPGVTVRAGFGVDFGGVDIDVVIQPFMWLFVPERDCFQPRIGVRVAPPARNVTIVRSTRTVVNYVVVRDRVVNRGVEIDRIERTTGHPAPRYRVVDSDTRGRPVVTREQEVRVFRRPLKPAPEDRRPARGRVVEDDHDRGAASRPAPVPPPTTPPPARPATPATTPTPDRPAGTTRPGAPPTGAAASEANRKQADAERQELEKRLAAQREALRREQEKDARHPPSGADAENLRKAHEAEQRAFDEDARRQRELLKHRQEDRGDKDADRTPPPKKKAGKPEKKPEGNEAQKGEK
jgi:hypothetical protein